MEDIILEKRFGDIDKEWSGLKKAKACIIQAPYEGTVTYKKGTSKGPEAIINASLNMELFDDELQTETYKIGIFTARPIDFAEDSPVKAVDKVKNMVSEVLTAGKFPVLLGGEHSLTAGAVSAFKGAFPNLSVLYLDAHYDLRDEYKGSKYNHACVARRIQEMCPVVETGVRSLSKEEKDFLNTAPERVKIMSVYDILEANNWKKDVSRMLTDTVYISIDLDVLDPSLMPSTGTPEPGGLGWYELLDFLKLVTKEKKVVGFDVVELAPAKGGEAADFLAAKIIYRLLGYVFNAKR